MIFDEEQKARETDVEADDNPRGGPRSCEMPPTPELNYAKKERKTARPRQRNGRFLPQKITTALLRTSELDGIEELIPPMERWSISSP